MSAVYNRAPGIHRAQLDMEQAITVKPEPWRLTVDLYRPKGCRDNSKPDACAHRTSLGEHNRYRASYTHRPATSPGERVNLVIEDIESCGLSVDAANRIATLQLAGDSIWLCERYC